MAMRSPLRAAALAAFVTGTVLLFLRPPSFDGAWGLLGLAGGAVALILGTAWATVALTGRDGPSEREFEWMVRRSEQLARRPPRLRPETDFERLVAQAIDRLPEDFRRLLDDTPVVVSRRGARAGAYGHYFGDTAAREHHEDRIVLYQDTLERDFGHDPELLTDQVEQTLRHELAHHLGWDERGVRGLGL